MNKAIAFASGIGIGGGLMYLFDPDRGRRRRSLIRDKAAGAVRDVDDAINKSARDIGNRAKGVMAEARSLFSFGEIPDEILVTRVQAKIGRLVSHPHAIEVSVDDGEVTLRGPVLSSEADTLVRGVSIMRGVTGVRNRLEAHDRAEDVPGLQGRTRRTGPRPDVLQANWSPATRLIMGTVGGALAVYGITHRNVLGAGAGAVGAGLLARGITNQKMAYLPRLERVLRRAA
jgi:hypothetical protein